MNPSNQQPTSDGTSTEIVIRCPMIILLDGEIADLDRKVNAFGRHYQAVFASRGNGHRPERKSQEQIKAEIDAIGKQGSKVMRRLNFLGEAYPGEFFRG